MPSIAEALANANTPLSDALDAGLESIGYQQTIEFVKYIRTALPLDGSVFWVRSDLIGAEAMQNPTLVGTTAVSPTPTITVTGALHRTSKRTQEADQVIDVQSIIFTAETEVQPLSEINPVIMWLGNFEGVNFAFGSRNSYFAQANKHHYIGDAVYPTLATQIIDNLTNLSQRQVVSNSLPVWLSLDKFFPVYTSYLSPENRQPPYATADIEPSSLKILQATPYQDRQGSRWQLVTERVKITMFGVRNDAALDYVYYVIEQAALFEQFGISNMPALRDLKRMQTELSTIAIAKSVEFEVNYYQARMNDIIRQLITKVIPTYILGA